MTSRQIGTLTNRQTDTLTNRQTHRHTSRLKHCHTDRCTDRNKQILWKIDRLKNRQKKTHTKRLKHQYTDRQIDHKQTETLTQPGQTSTLTNWQSDGHKDRQIHWHKQTLTQIDIYNVKYTDGHTDKQINRHTDTKRHLSNVTLTYCNKTQTKIHTHTDMLNY